MSPAQSRGAASASVKRSGSGKANRSSATAQRGEPAVEVVAGEAGARAEVLPARAAEGALSAGEAQPGDADPVARAEPGRARPGPDDPPHHLVARHDPVAGEGEVAVHDVEVGPADAAGLDLDEDLSGPGPGIRAGPPR